ncbi:MAG: flavodoxin [Lachnospiraceae bacterium]|nr:flavodoxin [Lachnospiraceae bacterium]
MKKICICMMLCVSILLVSSCGKSSDNSNSQKQEVTSESKAENSQTKVQTGEDILIVYFTRIDNVDKPEEVDAVSSASLIEKDETKYGNTEYIANLIQQSVGGELLPIKVSEKYSSDYDTTVDRAEKENSERAYPELDMDMEDIENYSVVFLGYPNWWYDMPMAMYSFLETYDLSGKTVIPFGTSGGSRFSDSISKIQKMQPDATVIEDGFSVSHFDIEDCTVDDVDDWISSLDVAFNE